MNILLPTLILILTAPASAGDPTAAAPSSSTNASDFIRARCEATQYPDVCYNSLAGYARKVQGDPARLAIAAIGVSLSRAKRMSAYLGSLARRRLSGASANDDDPRVLAAIRDCSTVFDDALEQMRGSMRQMRRLTAPFYGGEELQFEVSNVQTWMSAALTNEETCTDGFDGVEDSPTKADICDRTVEVKEVTSNALALVNSFATHH